MTSLATGAAIGVALIAGSLLGFLPRVPEEIASAVTAFAAGILISAVGLEVVPEADELAGVWLTAAGLAAGAAVFVVADWALTREERRHDFRRSLHRAAAGRVEVASGGAGEAHRGLSIALGIFIDGVPETAALGLMISQGEIGLALLAGIVVSNLTESYGATVFLVHGGRSRTFALGIFAAIAVCLVAALVVGSTLLAALSDGAIGFAEGVAGGAVLATVSISILPNAFLAVSRFAAIAVVLGFVAGFLLR